MGSVSETMQFRCTWATCQSETVSRPESERKVHSAVVSAVCPALINSPGLIDSPTLLAVAQAVEQYEAIKRKEDEAGGELREAQAVLQAATAAFSEVEGRRLDTFNGAFDHICHHIDPIFKVRHVLHIASRRRIRPALYRSQGAMWYQSAVKHQPRLEALSLPLVHHQCCFVSAK